jgi:hypothetical protein
MKYFKNVLIGILAFVLPLAAHAALAQTQPQSNVQLFPPSQVDICQQPGGAFLQWDGVGSVSCAQAPVLHDIKSFTTAGSYQFTVPAGIVRLWVRLVGGGGGGGGGSGSSLSGQTWSGGGGGSAGYSEGFMNVTPGQVIQVNVGAGGDGEPAGENGAWANSGGTTSFLSMRATGGGGAAGGTSTQSGGGPGMGYGGQINLPGGTGGDGNPNNLSQGGNGAASAYGSGGRTATFNAPEVVNGRAPGSGGGGIWAAADQACDDAGGRGADGAIFLVY